VCEYAFVWKISHTMFLLRTMCITSYNDKLKLESMPLTQTNSYVTQLKLPKKTTGIYIHIYIYISILYCHLYKLIFKISNVSPRLEILAKINSSTKESQWGCKRVMSFFQINIEISGLGREEEEKYFWCHFYFPLTFSCVMCLLCVICSTNLFLFYFL
jgi:hypothetical protein